MSVVVNPDNSLMIGQEATTNEDENSVSVEIPVQENTETMQKPYGILICLCIDSTICFINLIFFQNFAFGLLHLLAISSCIYGLKNLATNYIKIYIFFHILVILYYGIRFNIILSAIYGFYNILCISYAINTIKKLENVLNNTLDSMI